MIAVRVKRNIKLPIDKSILVEAAKFTLEKTKSSKDSDLSVVIGNDAFLQKLNLKYRQVNAATDVLSFPSGEVDPDTSIQYLGDVIISLPRAEQQASDAGHSLTEELQLLVVHGILHLLGYDHLEVKDKKRMQAAQDLILSLLGVHITSKL